MIRFAALSPSEIGSSDDPFRRHNILTDRRDQGVETLELPLFANPIDELKLQRLAVDLVIEPEEVAQAALYLCGANSGGVSGQSLQISGGDA